MAKNGITLRKNRMQFLEMMKYLSLFVFVFLKNHKLKDDTMSNMFSGIGIGVIANVMFVITTSKKYDLLSLTISFLLAIILLLIGSIEKKDK